MYPLISEMYPLLISIYAVSIKKNFLLRKNILTSMWKSVFHPNEFFGSHKKVKNNTHISIQTFLECCLVEILWTWMYPLFWLVGFHLLYVYCTYFGNGWQQVLYCCINVWTVLCKSSSVFSFCRIFWLKCRVLVLLIDALYRITY